MDIAKQAADIQSHLDSLEAFTKVKFDLEVDYIALVSQLEGGKKKEHGDKIGELVAKYLGAVRERFEELCRENSMNQESIQDFCTTKKISVKIYKGQKEFLEAAPKSWKKEYLDGRLRVVDGVLYIELSNPTLCYSFYGIANNFDDCFSGLPGGLSLKTRKNITDHSTALKQHLDKITKATGVAFEVEVDYGNFLSPIANEANRAKFSDIAGEIVEKYVEVLARVITTRCKDAMNKEALQELCKSSKISFQLYPNAKAYHSAQPKSWREHGDGRCRIVDGTLMLEFNAESFYVNTDYFFDNFDECFSGQN